MFAIVDIQGVQYKVQPSEKIYLPKLSDEVGKKVTFKKVLMLADETSVKIGTPTVKGSVVEGKVLGHVKDDKVVVFKKKRRKGYRVTRGHRQQYTQVEITKIG